MFSPDPGKAAMMILSKGDKMGEKDDEEAGPKDGLHAAAEDIMDAIHSKDAATLASGLKAFFDMADSGEEEDD